jgi:hypothetical protein
VKFPFDVDKWAVSNLNSVLDHHVHAKKRSFLPSQRPLASNTKMRPSKRLALTVSPILRLVARTVPCEFAFVSFPNISLRKASSQFEHAQTCNRGFVKIWVLGDWGNNSAWYMYMPEQCHGDLNSSNALSSSQAWGGGQEAWSWSLTGAHIQS